MENFKEIQNNLSEVINTDTLSGKILFVLAVLLFVYVFIRIIFMIMTYIYSTGSSETTFLDGFVTGNTTKEFTQNPNDTGDCGTSASKCSRPILLSNNEKSGIEFTWSFWMDVNPRKVFNYGNNASNYEITSCINNQVEGTQNCTTSEENRVVHIFHKGDKTANQNDNDLLRNVKLHNNGPGAYLGLIDNKDGSSIHNVVSNTDIESNVNVALLIFMDTISKPSSSSIPIIVPDIPTDKWVNVIIQAKQSTVYIYINGVLKKFHTYSDVLKTNYDSVHIGDDVDFGNISSLKYWNRAISSFEIASLIGKGPNLNPAAVSTLSTDFPRYLDVSWFDNGGISDD